MEPRYKKVSSFLNITGVKYTFGMLPDQCADLFNRNFQRFIDSGMYVDMTKASNKFAFNVYLLHKNGDVYVRQFKNPPCLAPLQEIKYDMVYYANHIDKKMFVAVLSVQCNLLMSPKAAGDDKALWISRLLNDSLFSKYYLTRAETPDYMDTINKTGIFLRTDISAKIMFAAGVLVRIFDEFPNERYGVVRLLKRGLPFDCAYIMGRIIKHKGTLGYLFGKGDGHDIYSMSSVEAMVNLKDNISKLSSAPTYASTGNYRPPIGAVLGPTVDQSLVSHILNKYGDYLDKVNDVDPFGSTYYRVDSLVLALEMCYQNDVLPQLESK